MLYLNSYVQRPTSAPSPQTSGVGVSAVAHRRKNKSGGYSEATILNNVILPNTFVYQGYNDSGNLENDEILVRQNSSSTWRKVPQGLLVNQVVNVPATVPTAWESVTVPELADNQAQFPITGVDFGTFSSATEPTLGFFLLNDGQETITSLDFGIQANDGVSLTQLSERVSVAYAGVLGPTGVGNYDTQSNNQFLYSFGGLNSVPIVVGPRSVIRVNVTLQNFPATGLSSASLSAQFLFSPNRSGFALPAFLDWGEGGLYFNANNPTQLIEENPNGLGIIVAPLTVRVGSLVYSFDIETSLTPQTTNTGDVDCVLYIGDSGSLGAIEASLSLPANSQIIAAFNYNTLLGTVTDEKITQNPQSPRFYLEPNAVITVGRSVTLDSSGYLVNGVPSIGVAVTDDGWYVPFGYVLIEVSEDVVQGERIAPDATGIYQPNASGTVVAIKDGPANQKVLAYRLAPVNTSGGGGGGGSSDPTDLSVTRNTTSVTVVSSTGTNAVLPFATTSLAGVLSAGDKTKLDGITANATSNSLDSVLLSRTNHTGTQTTATISDFTEATQDTLVDTLVAGTNVTLNYDDIAGTLTINSSGGGGGSDPTDLSTTYQAESFTIVSSTGTNAVVLPATTLLAGAFSPDDKTKLDGIATGATSNSLDSVLLSRTNHTGTQTTATISDFTEATQDTLVDTLVAGTNVTLNYDDIAGTLTINSSGGGGGSDPANLGISYFPGAATVSNSNGTGFDIATATTELAGLMSSTDKFKLNTVAQGANISNLAVTRQTETLTVTNSGGSNAILPVVTTSQAGLMLAADKTKLDGLSNSVTNLGSTASASTLTVTNSNGTGIVINPATSVNSGLFTPAEKLKLERLHNPAGTVTLFAGSIVPEGYLICNGGAVNRTTYALLFAAIGVIWGAGDGSTTFNLPNPMGRAPIGSGQGAGLTNRTLGQHIGSEAHALTVEQMPAHAHTLTTLQNAGAWGLAASPAGFDDRSLVANSGTGPTLNTGTTGNGQAHNNMQPSVVFHYIISTGL